MVSIILESGAGNIRCSICQPFVDEAAPAIDFPPFAVILPCPFMPETDRPILACFAFERGDARVKKRVAALQAQGWRVKGYMFHRIRDKVDPPPLWENVELGVTENRRYLKRAFVLVLSLRILWQHRAALREANEKWTIPLRELMQELEDSRSGLSR